MRARIKTIREKAPKIKNLLKSCAAITLVHNNEIQTHGAVIQSVYIQRRSIAHTRTRRAIHHINYAYANDVWHFDK